MIAAAARRLAFVYLAGMAVFLFAYVGMAVAAAADELKRTAPEQFFLDKVRPVLVTRCISCHGAEKQEGGLRLDSRDAALRGGDSGPSLVPGKPDDSLILMAVKGTHEVLEMPPKQKYTMRAIVSATAPQAQMGSAFSASQFMANGFHSAAVWRMGPWRRAGHVDRGGACAWRKAR